MVGTSDCCDVSVPGGQIGPACGIVDWNWVSGLLGWWDVAGKRPNWTQRPTTTTTWRNEKIG